MMTKRYSSSGSTIQAILAKMDGRSMGLAILLPHRQKIDFMMSLDVDIKE